MAVAVAHVSATPARGVAGGLSVLGSHGKPRWGDKRPMYDQHLDAIFAMFPDAQFVHLVRDPRATVASVRRVGWSGGDVVAPTELWGRSLRAVDAWRGRLAPDQLLEIRYEDLVMEPRATMERVCGFLGLAAEGIDNMLAFHEHGDIPQNRHHWQVSRPVTAASVRARPVAARLTNGQRAAD
ncbi:MAG: hypothetical protein GEV03_25240 [Streptosporangiales bacterium]|nr:hypothetical protein [Streptosporangiales bacterium]